MGSVQKERIISYTNNLFSYNTEVILKLSVLV